MTHDKLTHAARILRLRELLDSRAFVTIRGLMEEFGVTRKTVYNDFDTLAEAGVPIVEEIGSDGRARRRLEMAAKKKTITLGIGQVLPLGLALQALSFLENTEVYSALDAVIQKLSLGATEKTKKHLASLKKKVHIVPHGPKDYSDKAEVLDELLSGLMYDHLVEIQYRAPGKRAKKHVVEPLSLVLYREALYLVAACRTYDGLRIPFAVDRIRDATWLKGKGFVYPEDYTPGDGFGDAFGLVPGDRQQVVVIFEEQQARYVQERRWHPSQTFEKLDDGRVQMTMEVAGLQDVLLWLVGHCGSFEVVSPPELRSQVRETLKRGAAAHRGRASKPASSR
jgi:predicted DNA-binding transcriptional regulator YafY